MNEATLLLCAAASPVLLGIYLNSCKVAQFCDTQKTDIALVQNFAKALEWLQTNHCEIAQLIIARGPGSNTSLKLSYLFAQTIAIAKNIPVAGVESFALNGNQPIFAFGQSYFVKQGDTIALVKNVESGCFALPQNLTDLHCTSDCEPLYVLNPLG